MILPLIGAVLLLLHQIYDAFVSLRALKQAKDSKQMNHFTPLTTIRRQEESEKALYEAAAALNQSSMPLHTNS
jgi:hypothetical protein